MIQIICEYKVKPNQVETFESVYAKPGDWQRLFKKSKAFKKREFVVKDQENHLYLTIDTWKSLPQYESFMEQYQKENQRLTLKYKPLIIYKNEIGIFNQA